MIPRSREEMTDEEFVKLMEERIASAKSGDTTDAIEFFSALEKEIEEMKKTS